MDVYHLRFTPTPDGLPRRGEPTLLGQLRLNELWAARCFADPTRRRIFNELRNGPKPVGAIAAKLPVSRPAVSQHLKVLREARLVSERPDGTRRLYFIDPHGLGDSEHGSTGCGTSRWPRFKLKSKGKAPARKGNENEQDRHRRPPSVRASMWRPRLTVRFMSSPRECRDGGSRATASTRNRQSRTL